jgi:hypothetical protein
MGIVGPVMLTWGWIRWILQREKRTFTAILSFIGFLLATASALIAVAFILVAAFFGVYNLNPLWPSVSKIAAGLSVAGVMLGLGGVWRPGLLRWHCPVGAVGILSFWMSLLGLDHGC